MPNRDCLAVLHKFFADLCLYSSLLLRKKFVLGLVFVFSFLYFITSMLNNYNSQAKHYSSNIYDYEFAYLKRQHHLKDIFSNFTEDRNKKFKYNSLNTNATNRLNDIVESLNDKLYGIKCRNSVQGKVLIADDRGYVCRRSAFDINGCCSEKHPKTTLYSCDTCQTKTGCCSIYEYCISCCMSPVNRQLLSQMVEDKNSEIFRIFIASISDYFELCLTKCRTSSSSVLHENTYRNPSAKHCFGDVR